MKPPDVRHRLVTAVVALVALAGLVLVVLDWSQVRDVLKQADWRPLPAAVLFTAVSYACLSLGFATACRGFGIRLTGRDLFDIGFVSTVINHLLSTAGAAGYSVRFLLMQKRGAALNDTLAASVFHSYLNTLGMLALLAAGMAYLLAVHPLAAGSEAAVGAGAAVIGLIFVLATAIIVSARVRGAVLRLAGRITRAVVRRDVADALTEFDTTIGRGIAAFRARPGQLALLIALIAADWSASVAVLGFCFKALASPVSVGVLLAGFGIGVTAGVVSMVPGGLGVQEGSMAGIYGLLGVPLHQAVLAAILFRAVYYLLPYVVSLSFYRRLLQQVAASETTSMSA
jgi:uncharacterized protein (TIRG00374 family)